MNKDDKSPADVIRQYYPLEGAVEPLVELAKVSPHTLRAVIELAMTMGIYAEQRKQWVRENPSPFTFGWSK